MKQKSLDWVAGFSLPGPAGGRGRAVRGRMKCPIREGNVQALTREQKEKFIKIIRETLELKVKPKITFPKLNINPSLALFWRGLREPETDPAVRVLL
jgi:hypothetical protein